MRLNVDEYQSLLTEIRFGKRVGTSLYIHESGVPILPKSIQQLVNGVIETNIPKESFNVIKADVRAPIFSFLLYPEFLTNAFPTLERSVIWNALTGEIKAREFSSVTSRPVLHRKELLLPPGDERIEAFAELSEIAEQVGLFDDPSRIGRSEYWNELLDGKAIKVIGHALYDSAGNRLVLDDESAIPRYRTALKRNRLSVPIQALFKHGQLEEGTTLFDYGCGRGDDVRQLQEMSVDALGWDPHFAPDQPLKKAEVVNLGYVVNVIEDPSERVEVIKKAFGLANRLLVVSALTGSPSYSNNARSFKDGVITSTGTFQRYFQQDELTALVRTSIDREPISVGPGVLFIFSDQSAEQEFIAERLAVRSRAPRRPSFKSVQDLSDGARVEAEQYWEACLSLGRPATPAEVDNCSELLTAVPSSRVLFDLVCKENDTDAFEKAASRRRKKLLVDFALAQFRSKVFFKYFPERLKNDVRFHFGSYSQLQHEAKALLYSISDVPSLLDACVGASDEGLGFLLDDHSLQLHQSLLDDLEPILRVYVGCAGLLYGDWSGADLVKIHIQSGKVSFMGYDDFEGKPVPELLERVKVKLWQRDVEYYDYIGQFTPKPLLMKSLFINETSDCFEEQCRFDRQLMRAGVVDTSSQVMTKDQFYGALSSEGYRIEGYELVRTA